MSEIQREVEVGTRKYQLIIRPESNKTSSVWVMDTTGEAFTRFALVVENGNLKKKLSELKDTLDKESQQYAGRKDT